MTSFHVLDPNPTGQPIVLLLHGLGANGASWTLQMPVLKACGFRPIAPDVPGFGSSPYDGRGWSIQRMASLVEGLLEELQSGPAHVVGLSMGGTIAQQFALDFPQMTSKLILASTFAVLRPSHLKGWLYFLNRLLLVNTLGLKAQAKVVSWRVFPEPKDVSLREMLEASISHANPRAYRKAMLSLGLFDSRKKLGRIHSPTLVITGANDTTVLPAHQKVLTDSIPGARQVTILNAGHAIPIDQADAFNRIMVDFLKQAV